MKNLTFLLLFTLTCSLGSTAFAAKEVFERVKPHCNVGTIGHTETASLTLAIALAAQNSVEEAYDTKTGIVTAQVETEHADYEITGSTGGGLAGAKAKDAYFVKVDLETTTQQTREHILLARQVGAAVVVFLDVKVGTDPREVERCLKALQVQLREAGYSESNSGVVAGSIDSALGGGKEALTAVIDLLDTLDRCLGD